jgi:hypothetical protein
MRVLAYCAESYREATRRAAGVTPLTCPPLESLTFDPYWLEGHDLVWIDLHGLPLDRAWYGDGRRRALLAHDVHRLELGGTVVFAASCHLDQDSPMLAAFLDAGATVIGGPGLNYAGRETVLGAGLLGMWLRRGLQAGLDAARALAVARARVRLTAIMGTNRMAARDALGFRMWR